MRARPPVEKDARDRAAQTLADGKPILDKALLIRCAEEIEYLKAALTEIAEDGGTKGGLWARRRAQDALDRES